MPENTQIVSEQKRLSDYVAEHGSIRTPLFQLVNSELPQFSSNFSGVDMADIAHFMCILHGRHPGIVDHAATRTIEDAAREWLIAAMDGFAAERAFLTRLTVAAGPIIGTGVADQSEATVVGQRKALNLLAQSDRKGCALGAALALVIDWHDIRKVLDAISLKLGVEPAPLMLPDVHHTETLHAQYATDAATARAQFFGADQVLTQHRGLWQLLDARSKARSDN